jgi:hypothetical protein
LLANNASILVAACKPLVQTIVVKVIVTGFAFQIGQFERFDMEHRVADWTGFNSFKFFVDIFLPQHEGIIQGSSLVVDHLGNDE